MDEARHALNEIIIHNTELLRRKRSFIDQRRGLEQKINVRQRKLVIYLRPIIFLAKILYKALKPVIVCAFVDTKA